jgi:hypothetical protein
MGIGPNRGDGRVGLTLQVLKTYARRNPSGLSLVVLKTTHTAEIGRTHY